MKVMLKDAKLTEELEVNEMNEVNKNIDVSSPKIIEHLICPKHIGKIKDKKFR